MTTPAQPEPDPPLQPTAPVHDPMPGQPAVAAPPRSGKRRPVTILLSLVVLLGVLLGAAWYFNRDAAANANVGDCLHDPGDSKLKIVKCDGGDADFVVLGKVSGKKQSEATGPFTSVCDQWPDSTNTFWQGEQGKQGDVLCLKSTKQ
ncbi:LppU/SCO3897 family protein [Dactylosporangium sp. CA-139114]|uniref:LppU/SCO3897 family protein n=1 Tax=Dactylosporangium sp. CA-139114 TaxID=3239931 RepID=UPI003D972BFB